jgi:hypothetical protein
MEVPVQEILRRLGGLLLREKMKSLPKLPQLSLKKPLAKKPEEPSSSAQPENAAQPGGHAPIGIKPKHGTAPLSAPGRRRSATTTDRFTARTATRATRAGAQHDTVPLINAIHVKRPAQATAPRRQELERPMQLKPNAGKPPRRKATPRRNPRRSRPEKSASRPPTWRAPS